MATYAIGDVQGCLEPLQRLLAHIQYDDRSDQLWFCGDLVNRGPQSVDVLRFIRGLNNTVVTLGNHDLHLLAVAAGKRRYRDKDTFQDCLDAPDSDELLTWLRQQHFCHADESLNALLCHAGIYPLWDKATALQEARALERALQSSDYADFLAVAFGKKPVAWQDDLSPDDRLRFSSNCFTRMRICDAAGHIDFGYKSRLDSIPAGFMPWYRHPQSLIQHIPVIFGHWAALDARSGEANAHAIDSGCVWGGHLTALRVDDWQRFTVPC